MSAPLSLSEVKAIAAAAQAVPVDPMLAEILPGPLLNYVQAAPSIWSALSSLESERNKLERDIQDFREALNEYAAQTGSGPLMFDNIQLCLDQVRMRKQGRV